MATQTGFGKTCLGPPTTILLHPTVHLNVVQNLSGIDHNSLPSISLKLSVLNGSDPLCPCLGGAPGWKKLVKLEPTFHTNTILSSTDTVTNRRPSGEKLIPDNCCLCRSNTYSLVAVLRSYKITAPSLVPTARR